VRYMPVLGLPIQMKTDRRLSPNPELITQKLRAPNHRAGHAILTGSPTGPLATGRRSYGEMLTVLESPSTAAPMCKLTQGIAFNCGYVNETAIAL